MHQSRTDNHLKIPRHLLLTPSDSLGAASLSNFKDLGAHTLRESAAFASIRNFTKTYPIHSDYRSPSFVAKYRRLNSLYADEGTFLSFSSFGVNGQLEADAISSLGNSFTSTILDSESFLRFLNSSTGINLANPIYLLSTSPSPLTPTKPTIDV